MGLRVDSLADLPEQVRKQVGGKIAAQASKYHNRRMKMSYDEIISRLRAWANGDTCKDCPAKDDLAFCAADAIYDLLSRVEAIRPVSREQVEKVWRVHWNESTHLGGFVYCSRCGYNALEANNYTFCPKCGSPFTDEAVEMVMERMEALHGQENS